MEVSSTAPDQSSILPALDTSTPEWLEDHYAVLKRYRERDPIHPVSTKATLSGRTLIEWHLTRYEDVTFALKDKRFAKELKSAFGPDYETYVAEKWPLLQESQSNWMLLRDPPHHTRLRSLVSQAFTPRMVEGLRERIQQIADELASALAEEPTGEPIDIIPGYAFALPVIVIAELLGVPAADRARFREWSNLIARTLDNCTEEELVSAEQAVVEIRDYLRGIVANREKSPRDDLISGLIRARDEHGKLNELELIDTCILLLVAGHETTVNLIANGILLLGKHPATIQLLTSDSALYQGAVEEILRYEGSVQVTGRIVTEDVQMGERTLHRGDWVTLWLAAANRDPNHFPDPDVFDISRAQGRHITFGGGVHFCLGAPLARLEGEIALRTFVGRFPLYRIAHDRPLWRQAVTFRTLRALPVVL